MFGDIFRREPDTPLNISTRIAGLNVLALYSLLIKKGIITEEEYKDEHAKLTTYCRSVFEGNIERSAANAPDDLGAFLEPVMGLTTY